MTVFWAITGLGTLAVAALLAMALLRARAAGSGPAEAYDLQVYRDQLREIERDAARGTIGAEEAERLKTEVSRRILSADARMRGATAPGTARGPGRVMAVVLALVLLGGAFGLYMRLGAPGYGDLGLRDRIAMAKELRSTRPTQAEAEAQMPVQAPVDAPEDYLALVTRLREAVAARPDDIQGHVLLARSESALGNYRAAYEAQKRLIALKGESVTARDFADLADMLVLAAGGYVSPEAEQALDQVMTRDPKNGVARYYGGLMMAQTGRPDAAFRIWDQLLRESGAQDPWVEPIREQIPEMALRAGVNDYQLPGAMALPGPSAADMQAAGEMTEEERNQMVQGMVDNLSERLATQGGSPEEWSRLLGALGVLGETDRARAIWTEAQTVFAGKPEALEIVRQGAARAGISD